jgi:DNA topoisomerase-1
MNRNKNRKIYKQPSSIHSANLTHATYLVIVESPSKCAKIEHYLGEEYCCIASKGHLREINGLKSIATKTTFQPTFSIITEKQSHVDNMRKIMAGFSKENIILATDDDREGEAIAWHICDLFDLSTKTTKRIVFHEITMQAIQASIQNMTTINMPLVMAQHARQVLDVIVGYKISPFLWKYLYNNKTNSLSAGRCQTPALRLVYENQASRSADVVRTYKVQGVFFSSNICFQLSQEFDTDVEVLNFLEKSISNKHMLGIAPPKPISRAPPIPYNTSRLLQTSSNLLHYSPKETMDLCQKLYQSGYITYMRTESCQYSKTFIEQATQYIQKEWSEKYIGDLSKVESKDASNPHEAIRVTQINVRAIPKSDDSRLETMYKLIWRNTVESCMSPAIYNATSLTITAALDLQFRHTIEVPVFLGWKAIQDKSVSITAEQNGPSALLMQLQMIASAKKPISYNKIGSDIHVQKKHSFYTEAGLINKLEELGIGRPSTFATIVDTIQARGYVNRIDIAGESMKCNSYNLADGNITVVQVEKVFGGEKQKLVLQPVGQLTIEFLLRHFNGLFDYEYTKNMELDLDNVSNGTNEDWSEICKKCMVEIKNHSTQLNGLSKQSFPIEDGYTYMFEKYGPVVKHVLDDGTIEYIPAKKEMNIDLEKLKNGMYTLDDLIEISCISIGTHESKEVLIKRGRYGVYVECGDLRESIKTITKPMETITMEDIQPFLCSPPEKSTEPKLDLRPLNEYMSVRHGKYGAYVYYKRPEMKKPQFLNVKKCPHGYLNCEVDVLVKWLCETYKIQL